VNADAPVTPPPRPHAEVAAEIARLARALGETAGVVLPQVEVDDAGYHVVVVSNGREVLRDSTTDVDELLYWVFAGVTHQLAFARQLELLGRLGPEMVARREAEIRRILESAPYRDRPRGA
jgi:hypothetical protein